MVCNANFLSALKNILTPEIFAPCWVVAYSGGIDSHALLVALHQLRQENGSLPLLRAIHVNHNLQENAALVETHCQAVCDSLNIPLQRVSVRVCRQKGESIEAIARAMRYDVFLQCLSKEERIFTAHHLDDQAETLLLQGLRGAGIRGLSGMLQSVTFGSGKLVRPFLSFSRAQLLLFAEHNQLMWMEDPSNQEVCLARNYIRQHVMPSIKAQFPQAAKTLSRSAAHCAQTQALLSEYVHDDLLRTLDERGEALFLPVFLRFSRLKQREILRAYFSSLHYPLPSEVKLEHVLRNVVLARIDAAPCVSWAGVDVRRYQHKLYALAPLPWHDVRQVLSWDLKTPLQLQNNLGVLVAKPAKSSGLLLPADALVTVRFRRGGERLTLAGRGGHSLKKLFQEWGVKPWLRDRVPLVYVGERLAAVVGFATDQQFAASAGPRGVDISLLTSCDNILHSKTGI